MGPKVRKASLAELMVGCMLVAERLQNYFFVKYWVVELSGFLLCF